MKTKKTKLQAHCEQKKKTKQKKKKRTQNSHYMGEWKWQINSSSKEAEAEAAKFRSCQTQLANKSAAECKGKFKRETLVKGCQQVQPKTHTHTRTLPTNLKTLSKLSIQFKLMRREESCHKTAR